MDRALRDLDANWESYFQLRQDYDKILKHENMFNRPKEKQL
jgi:hypothetical protein